jgi:hypothetical protein
LLRAQIRRIGVETVDAVCRLRQRNVKCGAASSSAGPGLALCPSLRDMTGTE